MKSLWLRVVARARRDLDELGRNRPDLDLTQELEALLAAHWPKARQIAIEGLARQEAGDDERLYERICKRLDLELPQAYPYTHSSSDRKVK